MAIIRTVSLTKEHDEMIKKYNLKVSHILRKALDELDAYYSGELLDTNASLRAKVERLMSHLDNTYNFINEKGLYKEYHNVLDKTNEELNAK
jgi:hypothetical protein